jgi:hypothetical protein
VVDGLWLRPASGIPCLVDENSSDFLFHNLPLKVDTAADTQAAPAAAPLPG